MYKQNSITVFLIGCKLLLRKNIGYTWNRIFALLFADFQYSKKHREAIFNLEIKL